MTVDAVIRDFLAETRAKRQYEQRCGDLFELEDLERTVGRPDLAAEAHRAAIIAGHAAWAEEADPAPR